MRERTKIEVPYLPLVDKINNPRYRHTLRERIHLKGECQ